MLIYNIIYASSVFIHVCSYTTKLVLSKEPKYSRAKDCCNFKSNLAFGDFPLVYHIALSAGQGSVVRRCATP